MARTRGSLLLVALFAGCSVHNLAWLGGSLFHTSSHRRIAVAHGAVGGGADGANLLDAARKHASGDQARADFVKLDFNQDGKLDSSEAGSLLGADFIKYDADGDGKLSMTEYKSRVQFLFLLEEQFRKFTGADMNQDGYLDEKEAAAAGIDKKDFGALDKNKDGKLDDKEYKPPAPGDGGKSAADLNLDRLRKTSAKNPVGPFSPLVKFVAYIVGDAKLYELRKLGIQEHTKIISATINSWKDSSYGQSVFKQLFEASDTDKSGDLDVKELYESIQKIGFTWIKMKDCENILSRADSDGTGSIDLSEFPDAAMPTLRKNLAKLASANGKNLGLLS